MRILNLDELEKGLPGITPKIGGFLAEAAAMCLTLKGHQPGVVLEIEGEFEENFMLTWSSQIDEEVKRGWWDLKEAVEYGASAIAILSLVALTEFYRFERAQQKDNCDYFLKKAGEDENSAKLEISGILEATTFNSIKLRVLAKEKQISKAKRNLTAYVAIVEFSSPKTKIVKR